MIFIRVGPAQHRTAKRHFGGAGQEKALVAAMDGHFGHTGAAKGDAEAATRFSSDGTGGFFNGLSTGGRGEAA